MLISYGSFASSVDAPLTKKCKEVLLEKWKTQLEVYRNHSDISIKDPEIILDQSKPGLAGVISKFEQAGMLRNIMAIYRIRPSADGEACNVSMRGTAEQRSLNAPVNLESLSWVPSDREKEVAQSELRARDLNRKVAFQR